MATPRGVSCRAGGRVSASPDSVYDAVADPERFPELFDGFGPVPGIRAIQEDAAGGRRVLLRDGSTVEERFNVTEPGRRLVYEASGFAAPLGWWCRRAEGEWRFEARDSGTEVTWQYRFRTAGPIRRLAVRLLVAPFFQRAMARAVGRLTVACGGDRHY